MAEVSPPPAEPRNRRLFLVERFWPGVTPALAAEAAGRLGAAAARFVEQGARIRHVGSALLPDDEVVFAFVEADSVTSVRALSDCAAFVADRISESIPVEPWSSGRDE